VAEEIDLARGVFVLPSVAFEDANFCGIGLSLTRCCSAVSSWDIGRRGSATGSRRENANCTHWHAGYGQHVLGDTFG
jgi:hypothetical protein